MGVFNFIRYFIQTSELMESVRKVEDSLRRLRVARAVGGAQQVGGAGKTDDDKIRHQVHLDIQEYTTQVILTSLHQNIFFEVSG